MARPLKQGLDYFPFDVNFFTADEKILEVSLEFGPLGITVYVMLLCNIYGNGYYLKFKNLDMLATRILKDVGNNWVKKDKIVQIIQFLAECNLFNKSFMLKENVLTSAAIQSRYVKMTERRQSIANKKYWIIEDTVLNAPNNEVNVCINGVIVNSNFVYVYDNYTKESKLNESIEKYIKSKQIERNKLLPILNDFYITESRYLTHEELIQLFNMIELYGLDLTYYAAREAALKSKYTLQYIQGILSNWKKDGITATMIEEKNMSDHNYF